MGWLASHWLDSVTGHEPVLFGLKGIRRPQGHGVAFAAQERLQGFFGRHIFDGDFFLSQAEGFQPLVHGIVRGGACGAQDGFPAYRAARARHFGIKGVVAGMPEDGAVLACIDAGGQGFVIADGDDLGLVVQRCGQRGNGPAGGDFPMRRVHARHKLFSGIVREHFQTESFLQIPAFLFGIPSCEGFMLSEPCRFQRDGIGGVPDLRQAGQKQQGRTQPSKQFMHVKPPITDCFAIKRTSNSYAMSRYARKGP